MAAEIACALILVCSFALIQILLPWAGEPPESPESARRRMVREQLIRPGNEIENPSVLAAMQTIPRHEFVPENLRDHAYDDCALPIGFDQTISQPFIVALMTDKLNPKPTDRILEIGTGSGYQTAILAAIVREVYSIEVLELLGVRAGRTLKRLGFQNVHTRIGDGHEGWVDAAPFDAIIVTCAPERVPQLLLDQLCEGGRMIVPVGGPPSQQLLLLVKRSGRVQCESVLPVRFVPMTGGQGV